jgi:hypothetical protein
MENVNDKYGRNYSTLVNLHKSNFKPVEHFQFHMVIGGNSGNNSERVYPNKNQPDDFFNPENRRNADQSKKMFISIRNRMTAVISTMS